MDIPNPTEPEDSHTMRPGTRDGRPERRLAAVIEGIPQLVWLSADGGRWTWSCPRWTAYTGLGVEASQGLGWLDAVHPDDRGATQAAWREAVAGGVLDVEHRLLGRPGGEARWFRTHATPLPDAPGRAREWFGTCTDVHETRLQEARRGELLAELQRRIAGVFAVVRPVVRRTAKTGRTAEEFALRLEGRLDAIARTQLAAARDPGAGVDLAGLVAEELLAHAAQEGERVHIRGPAVRLADKAAGLFGLAVHELAANAVEHGALSAPEGRVEVAWCEEDAQAGRLLRFEWREMGVPLADVPPRRGGFGTELIERTLARELGATGSLCFGPDGVRCTVVLPLAGNVAGPDSGPAG